MKFNFSNLIKEYSTIFYLKKEEDGGLDGGRYKEGEKKVYECQAFIRNLGEKDVQLYDGGKFTTNDIKIRVPQDLKGFKLENIEGEKYKNEEEAELVSIQIEKEDIIFYDGGRYKVDREDKRTNNGDYKNFIAAKQSVSEGVIEIV